MKSVLFQLDPPWTPAADDERDLWTRVQLLVFPAETKPHIMYPQFHIQTQFEPTFVPFGTLLFSNGL